MAQLSVLRYEKTGQRSSHMTTDTILCVDDEPHILEALKRSFFDIPAKVLTASSGEEALELLRVHTVKVLICDERMPSMSGAQLLERVRQEFPHTIRIMLTGYASLDAAIAAINRGEIYRFFRKPWDDATLCFAVQAAIERYNLEAENRRLLELVRSQAVDMKLIERQYPGIASLDRDDQGRVIVSDISPDELKAIVQECERLFQ